MIVFNNGDVIMEGSCYIGDILYRGKVRTAILCTDVKMRPKLDLEMVIF